MRDLLIILGILLFSGVARAAPLTQALPLGTGTGYSVTLTENDLAGISTVGISFPLALVGFELGSSFEGNIYACELPQSGSITADECDLIIALTADLAPIEHQTTRLYYVLEITTPEGAGTTSRLVIRGTNEQLGKSIKILEGGVGLTADTQNPNDSDEDLVFDDPVICPDQCFFKASEAKGGAYWSAVTTDGATVTAWSPQNEVIIANFTWEPAGVTNWDNDAWATNACIAPSRAVTDRDAPVGCINSYATQYLRRTFLTRMVVAVTENSGVATSCDLRMAEYGGTVAVANTTMTIGSALIVAEDLVQQYIATEIPEGLYNFQGRNGGGGSDCPDAALCKCTTGIGGNPVFMGIPMI